MKWQINLDNFLGGYAPAYYNETYPSYGNKNQAGAMLNADLTNAGYLTQGAGLANLTNGSQAGAVTTLILGITRTPSVADVAYGIGGDKLYKFSSTAVTSDATWPHTIAKATKTAIWGFDVARYKDKLYYTYNHSGDQGDIGMYDLNVTFDDDWGSTVPTGAGVLSGGGGSDTTGIAGHPICIGGNDIMYIGNEGKVASWNDTTLVLTALTLPSRGFIPSLEWFNDRLYIACNTTPLTSINISKSSIFTWDGTTTSWESEIPVQGLIGGMKVLNGVLYVFFQDKSSTGGYTLGYVSGNSVVPITTFSGSLPNYYNIFLHKGFLCWNSGGSLYAYGAGDPALPSRLFQFADGGHTTVGGVTNVFSTPMVASWDAGSNYRFAQLSGYDVNSNWKSLMFDITGGGQTSRIENIRINHELLSTGARVDWKLLNNKGGTIYTDHISYDSASPNKTTAYYNLNGIVAENFRIEFDYTSGSTSNPVKIKNVKIYGSSA